MSIVNETAWEDLFPLRNAVYTYDGFLNAVGKFPAFCDEKPEESSWTDENMCKKELATVFANFVQETSYRSIALWENEGIEMFR